MYANLVMFTVITILLLHNALSCGYICARARGGRVIQPVLMHREMTVMRQRRMKKLDHPSWSIMYVFENLSCAWEPPRKLLKQTQLLQFVYYIYTVPVYVVYIKLD